MNLQIVSIGPFLLGFALFGPWVVPLILGAGWKPVIEIFLLIALGYL
jgi:O-antigen/teichoic acid export membrane protein